MKNKFQTLIKIFFFFFHACKSLMGLKLVNIFSGNNLSRPYDSHPGMAYHTGFLSRMGNSRLPPYPHPTTIQPLAQLKQAMSFPLTGGTKPLSPSGNDRQSKRKSSVSETVCVSSAFAPPRAWLVGSPSLTRDKRGNE